MPYGSELVSRATDLVPLLRSAGRPAVLLADAGVFRLRVPRRHGGFGCDTRTLVGVAAELGRAGGDAVWTAAASWGPTWLVTRFGAQARAEVFATPDVVVCGTPALTSTASPVDGGVFVDGRWPPEEDAAWRVAFTLVVPFAGEPYPVAVLLPSTPAAAGVFVPAHRVLALSTVACSVAPVWAASSVGAVVGAALDARDWFFDGLATDFGLPFGGGAAMAHTQTRDALTMIAESERVAHRLATTVDRGGFAAVDIRADLAEACRLAEEAVYLLATVHGSAPIRALGAVLETATTRILAEFDTATALTAWHRGR